MADSATDAVRAMVKMRDEVRSLMGGSGYRCMVQGPMDDLQAVARAKGISVLKAFELLGTEPVAHRDKATLAVLSAAVVELYELAGRTMHRMGE